MRMTSAVVTALYRHPVNRFTPELLSEAGGRIAVGDALEILP